MGNTESSPREAPGGGRGRQAGAPPQSVRAGSTSVQDRIASAKRMQEEADAHNHVLAGGKAAGKKGTNGMSKKEKKALKKSMRQSKRLAKAESKRKKKEMSKSKKLKGKGSASVSSVSRPASQDSSGPVSISAPVTEEPVKAPSPQKQDQMARAQADARRRAEEKAQQWAANEEARRASKSAAGGMPEAGDSLSVLDRVRQGEQLQQKASQEHAVITGAARRSGSTAAAEAKAAEQEERLQQLKERQEKQRQEAEAAAAREREDEKKRAQAAAEAEAKRKAEAEAEAAKRKAEAEAEAKRAAEAEAKRAAEAEAKRKAEAEAEAKRKAEAEAKRKSEAEAEAKRKAEAEAESKRKAEAEAATAKVSKEAAAAEEKRQAAIRKSQEAAAARKKAQEETEARDKQRAEEMRKKVEAMKNKGNEAKQKFGNPTRSESPSYGFAEEAPAAAKPQPKAEEEKPDILSPSALKAKAAAAKLAGPAASKEDEWEELDPRAVEAAKWVDKEIRKLIEQIKRLGTVGPSGKTEVKYGYMFVETDNIFEALSGTLKTAKKYKVVDYPGELLYQGASDNVDIVLLKETHDGIKVERRRKRSLVSTANAKTKGFNAGGGQTDNKCHVCSKTVYPNERAVASDKLFHKACFRCITCNKMLKTTEYCTVNDKFYCNAHYQQAFMKSANFNE